MVNTKISDGLVHRPELFCKMWNVKSDLQLDIDFIVKVLTSKRGYFSKLKHSAKISYFVNKWDNHQKNAKDLAQAIYNNSGKPTFYGSVQSNILKQVIK